MLKKTIVASLLAISNIGFSLDYTPWYSETFQPEIGLKYTYSRFHEVKTDGGDFEKTQNDQYLSLWTQLTALPNFNFQIQTDFAHTQQSDLYWEDVAFLGNYLWLEDVVGDPISLSTGLTMTVVPLHIGLKDYSVVHHSNLDTEFTLCLGKEFSYRYQWLARFWAYVGIGQGIEGNPWLDGQIAFEQQVFERNILSFYAFASKGLGHKEWLDSFPGYAKLDYEYFMGRAKYTHEFDLGGSFSLEYSRRFYVKNGPIKTNSWMISFNWPLAF
ncbi:MAG: hypothetical protein JHC93_06325 [Parachlamydiales bacterium]|nr:hypothetical protein [Parachlamydiales bacterium]